VQLELSGQFTKCPFHKIQNRYPGFEAGVVTESFRLTGLEKKSIFLQNCEARSATESLDLRLSQHYYSYHCCYGNITSIGYVQERYSPRVAVTVLVATPQKQGTPISH